MRAVGTRIALAVAAAAGAAGFAVVAMGQPLGLLVSGAPVSPSWIGLAWGSALAGLPMAALAYLAAVLLLRSIPDQRDWDGAVRGCLTAGLVGVGACSFVSGATLSAALVLFGASTVSQSGMGIVGPSIAILLGFAAVVAVGLWRMGEGGVWTAMGHVLWGLFGVTALTIGIPMVIEIGLIDDSRALFRRYNLFVVFYPVLWAAYATAAVTIAYAGWRFLQFSLSAQTASPSQRNAVNPPSTASTWPVTYDASFEIRNRAA